MYVKYKLHLHKYTLASASLAKENNYMNSYFYMDGFIFFMADF